MVRLAGPVGGVRSGIGSLPGSAGDVLDQVDVRRADLEDREGDQQRAEQARRQDTGSSQTTVGLWRGRGYTHASSLR